MALGFVLALKAQLFRFLEWLSAFRAPVEQRNNPPPPFGAGRSSAWVFVSTIGELNAVEPFLRKFIAEIAPTPITLITDRTVYRESYLAKYPDAYVYEADGSSADVARLARLTPPTLLLIAEIPCVLSDAPCRFPFAFVYETKRLGAPVALVNGWLYGQEAPSRLDSIEKNMFGRDYLRLMDVITVQNDDVHDRVIAAGGRTEAVQVTGNTKFDAVVRQAWSPTGKRSEPVLRTIVDSGRPTVVAGCVTEFEDQAMIVDAYERLQREVPDAFLVLAPRHPEQEERMTRLEALLKERLLSHAFRSRLRDGVLPEKLHVLVLDTMGELKDFYAVCTVAFVGRDHNLLEPLTFGRPVTVVSGWESKFPSYPVYRLIHRTPAVTEVSSTQALAAEWARRIASAAGDEAQALEATLVELRGASQRNLASIARLVAKLKMGDRRPDL